jgi:hypothetical protein
VLRGVSKMKPYPLNPLAANDPHDVGERFLPAPSPFLHRDQAKSPRLPQGALYRGARHPCPTGELVDVGTANAVMSGTARTRPCVSYAQCWIDDQGCDIPRRQGLAFMQLTRRTCRWPIGDPRKEDFCFCGATSVRGRPYCELHCGIAYAPAQRR